MKVYLIIPCYLLLAVIQSGGDVLLPHGSDFEVVEGFSNETPLAGEWATTNDAVVITDDESYFGAQSVRIPFNTPENILSLRFKPSDKSILYVDYYMQLTASDLPKLPLFTTPATTALLAVQPYGSGLGKWVFLDGDRVGSGVWLSTDNTMPLNSVNRTGWHRITLRFNLARDSWDAYVDGNLLAINLGFVETLSMGPKAINIYGNSAGDAYIDAFSITTSNPLFYDKDFDGMDDIIETAYGLDSSVDDRDLDNDLDGLTNIEEYLYGSNPTVFDLSTSSGSSVSSSALELTEINTSDPIRLHKGVLESVSEDWLTVELPYSYDSMVVVCTVNLPSANAPPAVARVRNALGNRFEVRLQNPGDQNSVSGYPVHYMVVEEGQYTLADDGVQMEAVKFESSITDSKSNWLGEFRSYLNSYNNPVVLGQVMTANDDDWSVFWASGDSRVDSPSVMTLKVSKHVGEDTRQVRVNETIGYIVIESGSGTIGTSHYIAGVGAGTVQGVETKPIYRDFVSEILNDLKTKGLSYLRKLKLLLFFIKSINAQNSNSGPPYNYSVNVLPSDVVITSTAAMKGVNGGWPVLYGDSPLENSQISLAVDEDQIADPERNHPSEQVAYIVLSEDEPHQPSDNDLLPDDWEIDQFGHLDETESGDPDADGISNMDEYRLATSPLVTDVDTDSDGIPDAIERLYISLDPNQADALIDSDCDRIPNIFEIYGNSNPDDSVSTPIYDDSSVTYFKVDASLAETNANTFSTITEAVIAARSYNYAVIEVLPGNYEETITLDSSILLIAPQGPEKTILRSKNPAEKAVTILNVCVLDGFTIHYDQGPTLELDSAEQITIKNCLITSEDVDLTITLGGGVSRSGGIVHLTNCYMPEAVELTLFPPSKDSVRQNSSLPTRSAN